MNKALMGKRTPWGRADYEKAVAPGITAYGTPGHGGLHVEADLNRQIPEYMRRDGGWYEEDCEWAIVAVVFPDRFSQQEREEAVRTFGNWFPAEYERFFAVELKPGDSFVRDEARFLAEHAKDWIGVAAEGDWAPGVPPGFVRVTATVGGRREPGSLAEDRAFLVPVVEYDQRDRHGFVVDPLRHAAVAPPPPQVPTLAAIVATLPVAATSRER